MKAAFTVGVVGPRWNRLHRSTAPVLRRRFSRLFRDLETMLRAAGSLARCRVACGLAEGADRIAVKALPDGWGLDAVLLEPIAAMLAAAQPEGARDLERVLATPLASVVRVPGVAADDFLAQANLILDRSDLLIAAWDGGSSAGPGGTRDSIDKALYRGIPVIWLATSSEYGTKPALLRRLSEDNGQETEALTPTRLRAIVAAVLRSSG